MYPVERERADEPNTERFRGSSENCGSDRRRVSLCWVDLIDDDNAARHNREEFEMSEYQALWDCEEEVSSLGIEVPDWIEHDIDASTVAAIMRGGCDSGAYMPAVTYHQALATMSEHGDEVMDYIDGLADSGLLDPTDAWSVLACRLLSVAVEQWAWGVADDLEEEIQNRNVE